MMKLENNERMSLSVCMARNQINQGLECAEKYLAKRDKHMILFMERYLEGMITIALYMDVISAPEYAAIGNFTRTLANAEHGFFE